MINTKSVQIRYIYKLTQFFIHITYMLQIIKESIVLVNTLATSSVVVKIINNSHIKFGRTRTLGLIRQS